MAGGSPHFAADDRVHSKPSAPAAILIFGWLWFLGALVPVRIAGNNYASLADRYMYVLRIGLFTALVWMLADAVGRSKWAFLISGVAGAVLLVFGALELDYRSVIGGTALRYGRIVWR